MSDTVKIWEEIVTIPTYEAGEADKNPVFLEKRVYQGSSGKVYPYPVIESISDEKVDKEYRAVYLENKYIKVMILPELGGRIQRAYDKTNEYDFVYYNHVIKPALVGLVGPWISGGIEFNWPQHHRPTTFMPVDHIVRENADGSKTVFVNDVDQMYGTKGIAGFTLYPDKAYIEITGQLYNRTPLPQTFLWWANPAVAVNEYTQSIFPPDVNAVMDHGKRDVSKFPIATGVYYKHDYREGVDISRYKNIPVPTSYMAEKSEYDFVGGYDYHLRAGILHVADHHISPGKKQWTWGCGDFGKAWDRNLTDEDGPYIELMTGVHTDNQPDFTWLKPFEEKTFKQYFMPYKAVGAVKNATIHAAVNMEARDKGIYVCVYATKEYENAKIILKNKNKICYEADIKISPVDIFEQTIPLEYEKETELEILVYNSDKLLVDYKPLEKKIEEVPSPAQAAKKPEDIMTNEELYLTGLHIEQYRHATYDPDSYYLEGLKRDAGDIRINNAYGVLLMRRGLFGEARKHFNTAIKRLTWKNPNPYDSEAYYNLGLVLLYQDKQKEAFDAFYKAAWSNEQQEMSFYYLALIETNRKNYREALELVEKSLVKNMHNIKARGLKAAILRKLFRVKEALDMVKENLELDPFDYLSKFELSMLDTENASGIRQEMNQTMRNFHHNYILTSWDYALAGLYEEAIALLRECSAKDPMLKYYEGYYLEKTGDKKAMDSYKMASVCLSDYCFPNKLEDLLVLKQALISYPEDAKAYYYIGLLYYDKKQYKEATLNWESSAKLDETFPTVFRNLALSYYNKMDRKEESREMLEKAFALNTEDARVFLELDQLYKKLEIPVEERLEVYENNRNTFEKRDDLVIEYITLCNLTREYKKAYELTMSRNFHPWEGGEGKITTQYKVSLVELAKEELKKENYVKAEEYLKKALVYPENLGEGRLEGTKDNNVYYYLGVIKEALGELDLAAEYFNMATAGETEPKGMMYYNDQPADMILYKGLSYLKLSELTKGNSCFYKLVDYGERHLFDKMKIEYFAVSLPDFLIFEEDLDRRNRAHCYYLIGLGNAGLGNREIAIDAFTKALECDQTNLNAIIYKRQVAKSN